MREEHAVALFGMACMLLVYGVVSVRDLPTIVGKIERLPRPLVNLPASVNWHRTHSRRRAVVSYVGWTVFTQWLSIVAVLASLEVIRGGTVVLGLAGAVELVSASGWTAYLLFLMRDS